MEQLSEAWLLGPRSSRKDRLEHSGKNKTILAVVCLSCRPGCHSTRQPSCKPINTPDNKNLKNGPGKIYRFHKAKQHLAESRPELPAEQSPSDPWGMRSCRFLSMVVSLYYDCCLKTCASCKRVCKCPTCPAPDSVCQLYCLTADIDALGFSLSQLKNFYAKGHSRHSHLGW